MYTLKSVARRSTLVGAAFTLVVAAVLPAGYASADALNPLTDRSLTLSSSSPGWSYSDGSGNTTYAPPNSGANGQKTGNTFDFKVSTDTTGATKVKTITLQYCTTSAGLCTSPGDNTDHLAGDTATTSDLNVVTSSPAEVASGDFNTVVDTTSGSIKAVPGFSNPQNPADTTGVYAAKDLTSNFTVYYDNAGTWTRSGGWTMTAHNVEDGTGTLTGKNNYIILANTTGLGIPSGTEVKVVFFGTANNYITNPGSGAFFVKINTYKIEYDAGVTHDVSDFAPTGNESDIIDGGVTVANVMNQSIQITTKVLETMQFSVGTVDPNTLSSDTTGDTVASELDNAYGAGIGVKQHLVCEPILKALTPSDPANVLKLGDQDAESSLSTEHTFSTHSYWRLSSNSSAGATVYYSGHTLSNTVGDQIDPIYSATANDGLKAAPARGAEQFGIALDNGTATDYDVSYAQEATYENGNDNGKTLDTAGLLADGASTNASWHTPKLAPLVPATNYSDGTGTIDNASPTTQFAFDPTSDTIPVALATEDTEVVDCVTGKMRYMANIAATTPAGIYTTKINYIAAPQY